LMKISVLICALILLAEVDGFTPPPASTLTQPPPSFVIHSKADNAPSFNPASDGGGGGGASGAGTTARAPVLQDYTTQSLALFQALLTPSTLLSGAVYSSMFSLPKVLTDNSLLLMEKRLYVLFCAGTLCCSLTTVMAVSMALFSLRFRDDEGEPAASSLREFLDEETGGLFNTCLVNFVLSVTGFLVVVATRAWHFITCPAFARTLVMFMSCSLVLILTIVERTLDRANPKRNGIGLPLIRREFFKYIRNSLKFWSRRDGKLTVDFMKAALVVMFVCAAWFLEKAVQSVIKFEIPGIP